MHFIRQAREYIADKSSVDSNGSLDFYDGPVSQSATGGYENEGFQSSTAVSLVSLCFFFYVFASCQLKIKKQGVKP